MEVHMHHIPQSTGKWELTRRLAGDVLHKGPFLQQSEPNEHFQKINFEVFLHPDPAAGAGHSVKGILTLPTKPIGFQFLDYVDQSPFKINGRKIKFFKLNRHDPPPWKTLTLQNTRYIDPDHEEKIEQKMYALHDSFRVNLVQFGILFRPDPHQAGQPLKSREYSIEWNGDYTEKGAWLRFEYDRKLICIEVGEEQEGSTIAISFSSIQKIAIGYDGPLYVCFDTFFPPVFEKKEFNRSSSGNHREDNQNYRLRLRSLHPGHQEVSPYAQKLRITLYDNRSVDIVETFKRYCKTAELPENKVLECKGDRARIEAARHEFFTQGRLHRLRLQFSRMEWPVAFQLESLLYNCLLHTGELEKLVPLVEELRTDLEKCSDFVAGVLRKYGERLQLRKPSEDIIKCFKDICSTFTYLPTSFLPGHFPCYHVTFTPTRLRLEGPYAMQSNRIIRRYDEHKDHFIRVDFRDEEGLSYRSAHRTMDGQTFLENRVGDVLKNGFELAGRRYRFQFLAYSSSGLGEHSVWFMQPFVHPQEGLVTAQTIRDSIIDPKSIRDYQDTKVQSLLKQPSKYAARLGLAFTATVPSVKIGSHEWTEVPDIQYGSQVFSDGIGTISETLGNRVWKAICHEDQAQNAVQPSAYMVRFLGYKGIVSVDKELDNVDGNVHMRLRESMRKFPGKVPEEADIEIAQAFLRPNKSYLNRALITVLEDRGVRKDAFLDLQRRAVAEIDTVDNSIADCHRFLRAHSLGRGGFHLAWILQELEKLDCDFKEKRTRTMIDNSFFKELRAVAKLHVVRDMRHKARIYLPDSYLLVGVADEGPVYRDAGYDNIYILPEAHIYACIQENSDEEPKWLEGSCTISRSPITHPGDVQRVHAIGKPPEGMRCLFGHMKNVVVLPSVGKYSLASCLGGGDLDGDMFSVIMCPELLPPRNAEPADYSSMNPYEIEDRECDVNDICDFVVQYINSDVLGLLSVELLKLADQSKEGIFDSHCKEIAKLCSQAVDYPKNGNKVVLADDIFSKKLIRRNPDWMTPEGEEESTAFYRSTRALGLLYRELVEAFPHSERMLHSDDGLPPGDRNAAVSLQAGSREDPISIVLREKVQPLLSPGSTSIDPSGKYEHIFNKYVDELQYICVTHTISNTPGVRLRETEVVMGTLMTREDDPHDRLRNDCASRMRLHVGELVRDVKRYFQRDSSDGGDSDGKDREALLFRLERAWSCWNYSLRQKTPQGQCEFGAASFGLIALGSVLHCLKELSKI